MVSEWFWMLLGFVSILHLNNYTHFWPFYFWMQVTNFFEQSKHLRKRLFLDLYFPEKEEKRITFSSSTNWSKWKKPSFPIQILTMGPNLRFKQNIWAFNTSKHPKILRKIYCVIQSICWCILLILPKSNIDFYTKCILNTDPLLPNKPKSYNR